MSRARGRRSDGVSICPAAERHKVIYGVSGVGKGDVPNSARQIR